MKAKMIILWVALVAGFWLVDLEAKPDQSKKTTARDPDEIILEIQRDLIELDRQFELIRKDLFFPKDSEVLFYLRNNLKEAFPLQGIDLWVGNRRVFEHQYQDSEKIAFQFSGLQPLYRMEMKSGDYQVTARYTVIADKGEKAAIREHRFQLKKGDLPRFVELELSYNRKIKGLAMAEKIW
jgi:hypothetical protein